MGHMILNGSNDRRSIYSNRWICRALTHLSANGSKMFKNQVRLRFIWIWFRHRKSRPKKIIQSNTQLIEYLDGPSSVNEFLTFVYLTQSQNNVLIRYPWTVGSKAIDNRPSRRPTTLGKALVVQLNWMAHRSSK